MAFPVIHNTCMYVCMHALLTVMSSWYELRGMANGTHIMEVLVKAGGKHVMVNTLKWQMDSVGEVRRSQTLLEGDA